jgi:hypothetical protein
MWKICPTLFSKIDSLCNITVEKSSQKVVTPSFLLHRYTQVRILGITIIISPPYRYIEHLTYP